MDAFIGICGCCFGWVGENIKTEAAHLIAYGDNIENLRKQVQNLSAAIKSVEDRIEEADNNQGATRVDAVVDTLMKRMASLKEKASKIISDEERESDCCGRCCCLMRLRPNLWACYLASKSAKKAIDEAVELLEEEKKLDRPVANVDYSQSLGVPPFPYFEEFESRASVSKAIVAALKDPNVNKVGVYGMGGTGKTTLAQKIGADLKENGTFSYVVLATVSEKQNQLEPNLLNIQNQIAGWFKIELKSEILSVRAAELHKQLEKKDKVLIILDDIWSGFKLQDVGIPVGSSAHTKFKILMTSRSELVLQNEMDSTSNFGLNSLPPNDARNLFDRMVGGDSQYSNWPLTAKQVVEQCGGIPILLATTGRALRNADQDTWEDALTQLKQFDGEDFDKEAYKRIEVSYKFLKSEEIKKLLRLCAQLDHRSILMEDLLKYAMGLDLFKERKTLKEVRGRLHKYLRDLKGCCLLQDGNKEGTIKMHDVVHKFATVVASRDHDVFSVGADGELKEWPSKDQFEKFTAISFFYCRLPSDHMLPAAFDNPKLESFLMLRSKIDESFKIPDKFFAGMKGLKLMNLTGMSLSPALVSSLSALEKIRTLCLDHCKLGDIAVIGELPMLQALSLNGSSIVCVPKEIGKLGSTLKLLDLCDCLKLEMIASSVISRLTSLEDLRIGSSFRNWEQLQRRSSNNISADETYEAEMASLDEFKNLRNLINLEIHIPEHSKIFPKDLVFKKLETFRISIGSPSLFSLMTIIRSRHWRIYELPRTLAVNESSTVVEFNSEGTKALMTRAESLRLEDVKSSVSVSEMDPNGFPELKHLRVVLGFGIQYIVKKNYNNCIFPKLETLDLWRLRKLERICDDHDHPPPFGSFENLRVIKVYGCNLLNDLLSSNLARGLLRLKEIRVEGCKSMESIIVSRESENEEEIEIGFTHQLRVLELNDLPDLLSFYRFKQLEGVPVPSPTPLFNKKIVFPKLEELNLNNMKIEKIWDDHLAIAVEGTCWLQNLRSVYVARCPTLTSIFPTSLVPTLQQLEVLEVRNCDSLEKVFDVQILPMNERETCRILPFQNLRKVRVSKCPSLTSIFPTSLVPTLQQLERLEVLEVRDCDSLEKVFDVQILAMNERETCRILPFQNLRSVLVSECPTLTSIFPTSLLPTLPQLEELEVRDCDKIDLSGLNNTQQLNDAFAKAAAIRRQQEQQLLN